MIAQVYSDLDATYGGFSNPHIWGNSCGHTSLWDIPRILRKCIDTGMTVDELPFLQNEILRARENLKQLKKSQANNPVKAALLYLLGKRD